MPERAIEQVRENLDAIYRAESGRILSMLIRWLGDFDLAKDACMTTSRRWWNAGRRTECRPILVLEAWDLNHAIQLMSKHRVVKAGPFEILPAADLSEMIRASEQRRTGGKATSK